MSSHKSQSPRIKPKQKKDDEVPLQLINEVPIDDIQNTKNNDDLSPMQTETPLIHEESHPMETARDSECAEGQTSAALPCTPIEFNKITPGQSKPPPPPRIEIPIDDDDSQYEDIEDDPLEAARIQTERCTEFLSKMQRNFQFQIQRRRRRK